MATALAKAGRNDLAAKTRMRLLTDYTNGRYTEQTYDFLTSELEALPVAEKIALAAKLSRANRYDEALELFERIPGGAPEARATRLRALFNSRKYGQLLEETERREARRSRRSCCCARAPRGATTSRRSSSPASTRSRSSSRRARKRRKRRSLRAKYYSTDVIDYAKCDRQPHQGHRRRRRRQRRRESLEPRLDVHARGASTTTRCRSSTATSAPIRTATGRRTRCSGPRRSTTGSAAPQERDAKAQQIVDEYPVQLLRIPRQASCGRRGHGSRPRTATPFPDMDAELAKISEPRFDVVRELQDVGLDRAAAREMKVLAVEVLLDIPACSSCSPTSTSAAASRSRPTRVLQRQFRQFVRHGGANIPQRFWEILFPLAYWDAIRAEAAAARASIRTCSASIIRQESGFEPTTVSNAGAVGLMQIMPEEAARIAAAGGLGAVDAGGPVRSARRTSPSARPSTRRSWRPMNGNHDPGHRLLQRRRDRRLARGLSSTPHR